ncbi:MAG: AAA family ATPase [bacterium]|nr:AAA family ATPase [bacterium]
MKTIVYGLLGTTLDLGKGPKRWQYWRPSIAVCMQEDLLVDEFHLLYDKNFRSLAKRVKEDVSHISPETGMHLHELGFADPWDFEEVYSGLADFFKGVNFDTDNNRYLVHITTGTHVVQICLFLLTESRRFPGMLLQTSPEGSRTRSSSGLYRIIDLDLSKYDTLASRFLLEKEDDISFLKSGIETKNKAFNGLIAMIERVALRSKEPILLMGPTGAGKSQLASRIYELKKIRNQVSGRFVEINCATMRGDAAMSALFGHKKGSFTGAVHDRPGLLKSADKGIVFLDEIGELGQDEQAMLLRAIEEKLFTPLGADEETHSVFQLICGTNRDLHESVRKGEFREDLLARINLWTFRLPGLKERPQDIEPNLDYELKRYEESTGNRVTFSKEARKTFLDFALSAEALWSANFRDLNGAVTRMCTLAAGGRISTTECEEEFARLKTGWRGLAINEPAEEDLLQQFGGRIDLEAVDPFDRVQLAYVIKTCKGSRTLSEAGRKLFACSRLQKAKPNDADRLKKYLTRFQLDWESICL